MAPEPVMRTFVINLAERTDRRDNVIRNLEATGVDFEFFTAIHGENALQHFSGINQLMCLLETGRFASTNEIGCYASHLSLWKICIELNEAIVIMEDDFSVTNRFNEVLAYATAMVEQCGFIRLEPLESRWAQKPGLEPVPVHERAGLRLLYQRMPSVRLTCYALTPACAAALVAVSESFAAPVDHVTRRCWIHGQPMYAIEPPAIELSGYAAESSITGREKNLVRHLISPIRAIYRSLERQRACRHASRMVNKSRFASTQTISKGSRI